MSLELSREKLPVPARLSRFAGLVRRPRGEVSLIEAALEIARDEYPDLDVSVCMAELDRLEKRAEEADPGPESLPRARLAALNQVLFRDEGFHGEGHEHMSDPRSAYLNDTLERRTGLPITMSVIYLEIGRRIGLELAGVGLPGHFLVRMREGESTLFIDPFNGGAFLDEDGCRTLLRTVTEGRLDMQPEYLLPWSTSRILGRILQNLKATYVKNEDFRRARRVIDLVLVLRPKSPSEIRDRGLLAYQSLLFAEAVDDLERYLRLYPKADDASDIRSQIESLRRLVPSMN